MSSERDSRMCFKRVICRNTLLTMGFGSMIGFGWVVLAGGWVVEVGSLGAIIVCLVGGLAIGFIGLIAALFLAGLGALLLFGTISNGSAGNFTPLLAGISQRIPKGSS